MPFRDGRNLIGNHLTRNLPVHALLVALLAKIFGQLKNNGNRWHFPLRRHRQQGTSRRWLNVSGINDSGAMPRQPLGQNQMQQFKCIIGGGLIIFVITHQSPAIIR